MHIMKFRSISLIGRFAVVGVFLICGADVGGTVGLADGVEPEGTQ
jgi:hypothetical protein